MFGLLPVILLPCYAVILLPCYAVNCYCVTVLQCYSVALLLPHAINIRLSHWCNLRGNLPSAERPPHPSQGVLYNSLYTIVMIKMMNIHHKIMPIIMMMQMQLQYHDLKITEKLQILPHRMLPVVKCCFLDLCAVTIHMKWISNATMSHCT